MIISGKNKLVIIVNLIRPDFLIWELFHLWNIPTISVDCECKGATVDGRQAHFHICRYFPYLVIVFVIQKFVFFQIHFVNFHRSIQMAAIKLQTIPSFHGKVSEKCLLLSANIYEKYIVCKNYCIAHHDDKTYFLPSRKYHKILFREIEELLHKLDTFCFT